MNVEIRFTTWFYKVIQIWLEQTVTCLHTNRPGYIWTTLFVHIPLRGLPEWLRKPTKNLSRDYCSVFPKCKIHVLVKSPLHYVIWMLKYII
jgi:hypothetical protein